MAITSASQLLAAARRGAGLTQRALARRARTSQSVIARIESGATCPSWRTLQRLLSKAGFELQATIRPLRRGRSHMLDDVPRILRLTPEQRLLELRNAARFFAAATRGDDGRV
jgi:transcriptional regulator with XRE-family HTH domain